MTLSLFKENFSTECEARIDSVPTSTYVGTPWINFHENWPPRTRLRAVRQPERKWDGDTGNMPVQSICQNVIVVTMVEHDPQLVPTSRGLRSRCSEGNLQEA